MPNYRVEINGQNFLIEYDGRVEKHGFFTWRIVEANDPTEAEHLAVELVRKAQQLRDLMRNPAEDPPVMEVLEVLGLESYDDEEVNEPGYVWYPEKQRKWWHLWKR